MPVAAAAAAGPAAAPVRPAAAYADRQTPLPQGARQLPANVGGGWQERYPEGTLAPEQFGAEGVATGAAAAICGPVAAVAFARAYGRSPTVAEALEIATLNGRWDAGSGMHGPASEQSLLADMGVGSRLEAAPTRESVIRDIASGNPVLLSSPGHYHYFVATAYDPATGLFDTGNTGLALRGGSRWRSWEDIGPQAALYLDEPTTPTPSPAVGGTMPQAGLPAPRTGAGVDRGGALDPTAAPSSVWALADAKSAAWGLGDPNVLRALVLAESGGNPGEIGDGGRSYGLLQAYTGPGGGRGSGHDPRRLLDPEYNLDIARDEITGAYRQALREGFHEGTPALARRVGELAQRPDPAYYHRYADAYASLQGDGPPGTEGVVPPGGSVLGGARVPPPAAAATPYPGSPAARGQVGSPFGPSYAPGGEYESPTALPDPFAALRAGQRTLDETLERTRQGIAGLPSAALGRVNERVAGLPGAVDDAFTPARGLDVGGLLHPFPADNPINAQYRRNVEAAGGTLGDPASVALAHSPNSITNQVDRVLQATGAPPMTERQKTTLDYALQTLPIGEADIRMGAEGAAGLVRGAEGAARAVEVAPPATRMYHGTGAAFDTPNPATFDPNGLFGPGYYLTDSPEVAGAAPRTLAAGGDVPRNAPDAGYAWQRGPIRAPTTRRELADAEATLTRYEQLAREATDPAQASMYRGWAAELRPAVEELRAGPSGPNVRAVDVPAGLRLLDVEGDAFAQDAQKVYRVLGRANKPRFEREMRRYYTGGPYKGENIYQALVDTVGNREDADLALKKAGYDGIRYAGGKRIPMADAAGNAIEHTAMVIFPESLPKIRNALSGRAGGRADVQAALLGGAAAGLGGAGYLAATMPQLGDARRDLARRAGGAVGGASEAARGLVDTTQGALNRVGPAVRAATPAPLRGAYDLARPMMLTPENMRRPLDDPAAEALAVRMAGPNPTPDALMDSRMALMQGYGMMGGLRTGRLRGAAADIGERYPAFVVGNYLSSTAGMIGNAIGTATLMPLQFLTRGLAGPNEAILRRLGVGAEDLGPLFGRRMAAQEGRGPAEWGPMAHGMWEGMLEAAQKVPRILTDRDFRPPGALDVSKEIWGGRYNPMNWTLRVYGGALDTIPSMMAKRMTYRQVAWLDAQARGLRGQDAADHVAQQLRWPTTDMLERGQTLADQWAMRDGRNQLVDLVGKLRKTPVVGPLLFPFANGAMAALKRAYEYSPASVATPLVKLARGGYSHPGGAAEAGVDLAKAQLGIGMSAVAVKLYNMGILTGARPTDQAAAREWDARGNVEDSINLGGGQHLPYGRLTPLALTLRGVTRYMDALRDGKAEPQAAIEAGRGFAQGAADLPFMQQWTQLLDLAEAIPRGREGDFGGQLERQATSMLRGWIPASSLLGAAARGMQDYPPDVQGVAERVQSGLPGIAAGTEGTPLEGAPLLSPRIRPKLGPAGEQLPGGAGLLPALTLPTTYRPPSAGPQAVYEEAARTEQPLPAAPTTVAGVTLTDDQQYRAKQILGPLAAQYRATLQGTEKYKSAPLEQQQRWTDRTDALARQDAAEQVMADDNIPPKRAEGEPERYDLQRLAPVLRKRLPAATVDAYVAHPVLFEAAARKAARKLALYKASRGATPRPATAELLLAQLTSPEARTPAWQRWSRDPARRRAAAEDDSFIAELGLPPDQPPPPTDGD